VAAVMTAVVPLVVVEVQEEFLAAVAVAAEVLTRREQAAQVDAAKSGCGFTNERHNKKESSRR